VAGLVTVVAIDAIILYPVQTAANLMAYETGYFDRADVTKLGLAMLAATILTVVLVLPYWAMLGLPLVSR
jgi:di/tricarboxylate transporter